VLPSHAPAHAMYEFKQCALSRTPRPPHPHCGHTHVPPFPPQSPHPSHVQHRPLFRCGDSTVLSAVPLPRPAAHPLAAAHASAVAPAASLDPLRPRAPNGQRMARHRCSTARRGSQHYDRCRGGNKQGATLPVKWRSLAGLLPGGGLKAGPPLDPPRPSIISPFHPPGQVPRIARGTLESGVVLGEAWSARYGVGLRPSFYSGSLGESLLVLLHGKPLGEALV